MGEVSAPSTETFEKQKISAKKWYLKMLLRTFGLHFCQSPTNLLAASPEKNSLSWHVFLFSCQEKLFLELFFGTRLDNPSNSFKTTTSLQNVILTAYNEFWKAAERNRQEWQKILRPVYGKVSRIDDSCRKQSFLKVLLRKFRLGF